jgi:hypothetical protein
VPLCDAAVGLDVLEGLHVQGGLEACRGLLRALAMPHVGGNLRGVRIRCRSLRPVEEEALQDEAARFLREGAWPSICTTGPLDHVVNMRNGHPKSTLPERSPLYQALMERRNTIEAADI